MTTSSAARRELAGSTRAVKVVAREGASPAAVFVSFCAAFGIAYELWSA